MIKITTHVKDALNRLLFQYRGKPRIEALIGTMVERVQGLEDTSVDTLEQSLLFNGETYPAKGIQLDRIGEIVGIKRSGLQDSEYLLFILGQIATNFSDATLPTILNIIKIIYQPDVAFVRDVYPNAIAFEIGNPQLNPAYFDLAKSIIQKALGATVSIVYIGQWNKPDVFRFGYRGGPKIGGGFADKNVLGSGGVFAEAIYTDANQ